MSSTSLCLLLPLLLTCNIVLAKQPDLVIGVFPRTNFSTTIKQFQPLSNYLATQLNLEVDLQTTQHFTDFWQNVKDSKYDIVHFNQYHYVKARKQFGYEVFAKNESNGKTVIAGSLIVRKDANIETVEQLRGKQIIFGAGRDAMQSYILATYLLMQHGITRADYTELFSINPPNAVIATYYGQAHAAGGGNELLDFPAVTQAIDSSELTYLAQTKSMAHLPWAIHPSITGQLRQTIQLAFTSLHKTISGRRVLQQANLTGIKTANDREYDPHRKIIFAVRGEQY